MSDEILSKEEVDEAGSNGIDLTALAASHEALANVLRIRTEQRDGAIFNCETLEGQRDRAEAALRTSQAEVVRALEMQEQQYHRAERAETALHTLEASYSQMQEWYTAYRRRNPEGEVVRLRAALARIRDSIPRNPDRGHAAFAREVARD